MGVVYEAVHSGRRRPEALKVLKGGLGASPDMLERFEREVQALSGFTHEHVVLLYDSGRVGDDLYYTMPLLPGPSLAQVIDDVQATGESPPGRSANLVLDRHGFAPAAEEGLSPGEAYCHRVAAALTGVCDALAVMHERGLLHRDVKPANLILDGKGRVLLADFGLVRWDDQRITRTGQALGTPAYMSPEQVVAGSEDPDGRTDTYALGATLYELLTLNLPHGGASNIDTLRQKLTRRVRPARALNSHVPERLETLVGRCLELRREDRYPSAGLLHDDLRRFAAGEPVQMRPVSPLRRVTNVLRRHRLPAGIAAAAIGTLAAAAGWYFSQPGFVTISTTPSYARVTIDGEILGTTPMTSTRIEPGKHVLSLERERFATVVRTIHVDRGSTFELEKVLQPEDPADPEAIRALVLALGLQVTSVDLTVTRGLVGAPPHALLFPRGRVRLAPSSIRLWSDESAERGRVLLMANGEAEPLAEWYTPYVIGRGDIEFDDAVRARLVPGGRYRLQVVDAEGRTVDATDFEILSAADAERVGRELATLSAQVGQDSPVRGFVEYEYLMGAELFEEAYEQATVLYEQLGARREVARAGLAALEQAGLKGRGLYEQLGARREVARAGLAALEQAGLKGRGWWSQWMGLHGQAEK